MFRPNKELTYGTITVLNTFIIFAIIAISSKHGDARSLLPLLHQCKIVDCSVENNKGSNNLDGSHYQASWKESGSKESHRLLGTGIVHNGSSTAANGATVASHLCLLGKIPFQKRWNASFDKDILVQIGV